MRVWPSPVPQLPGNGTSAVGSRRSLRLIGTPLLAAGLAIGTAVTVAALPGGQSQATTCPTGAVCVDATKQQLINNVDDVTLGPYAPVCGPSSVQRHLLPAGKDAAELANDTFALINQGSEPVTVRVYLAWQNDRRVGDPITDSDILGLPLPGPNYSSPGMAGYLLVDGQIGLEVPSLRSQGKDWSTAVQVAAHSQKEIGYAVAFGCAENVNDTQKELVKLEVGVAVEAEPTPTPTPDPSPSPTASEIPSVSPSVGPEPSPTSSGAPGGSTLPTGQPTGEPSASGVPVPSVAPSRPSRPGLAATGVNLTGVAVGVGGLVVAGGLLLLVRRRKRQD
ncbi:hypothetical protein [Actinomyces trachealis]|uniref:hypothetical protein n=1 Tax=Actinomyces trachealis TaxID=2763540 RepID=UPI0018C82DB6|nr:hypothetical protein [Actinomyces trachealis]